MNKLLKDAIADAKAVRETALANARVALEEAFAPKLQSMLSHKIKEEMEEEPTEEMPSEEDTMEVANMQKLAGITGESEDPENPMYEEETEEEPAMEMEPEEGEEEMEMDMEMEPEEGEEEMSDDDLEEILRELEGNGEEESMEDENLDPNAANYDADQNMNEEEESAPESEEDEEIDLEEIMSALREEEGEEEDMEKEGKMKTMEAELNEAYSVVKYLRSKLSEVNLLNAKLLFVNKLFRKGDLSETQKVKIIETFDRAKNVREAKLIFATLAESVSKTTKTAPKKKTMNEGFASAPQKKTEIITESNDVYSRFKSLVNFNR